MLLPNRSIIYSVDSDVSDPLEFQSIGGARFLVAFRESAPRWTILHPTAYKSDAVQHFKTFLASAERQIGGKFEAFHTDG